MVPVPINTTTRGRVAIVIGRDACVYIMEVNDMVELTMAHLHLVSRDRPLFFLSSFLFFS